jgi:hypothetical protein
LIALKPTSKSVLRTVRGNMVILLTLASAALQASSLPYLTWKERNQPDAPVLPKCELGSDAAHIRSMADLPSAALVEVKRLFKSYGISDVGGPFNSTDVIDGVVPQRRFIRAYRVRTELIIWYEKGGFVSGPRTVLMTQTNQNNERTSTFRTVRDTFFTGNLCAATKAILDGVQVATP